MNEELSKHAATKSIVATLLMLAGSGLYHSPAVADAELTKPKCEASEDWTRFDSAVWQRNEIFNLVTVRRNDTIAWNGSPIDDETLSRLMRVVYTMRDRPLTAVKDEGATCERLQTVRNLIAQYGCAHSACLDAPNLVRRLDSPPAPLPEY